jgi:MoaA/NifB/PqqE/SkfB family radical SAM enzyme
MDQSDLPFEIFEKTLERLPALGHLELQGEGEPLLHKDFFRMVALARRRDIKVSTISNGSLFTRSRIERIVDSGIQSIMISIESPDSGRFRAIRGGKLEKVKRGILDLIEYRNRVNKGHAPALPAVGFIVTVLKSTQHELSEIAGLYCELSMDGGVLMHALSPMAAYSSHYDQALNEELLSPMAQGLAWSRYKHLIMQSTLYESPVNHFWDDLLSRRKDDPGARELQSEFRSCPWLDNALFVNRHGVATACPNVKDYKRFGWGRLTSASAGRVLAERKLMTEDLENGVVPTACEDCFIAESVCSGRTTKLIANTQK